jgi:hypothetical protein
MYVRQYYYFYLKCLLGLRYIDVLQYFLWLKGTVRQDWICMRVVSLESPLKGHQLLYVFNF